MADKLPWFPLFVQDWLADEKLRACSSAARGLWIDLLCLMHRNDRRGFLEIAGRPASSVEIARMTGRTADEISQQLQELLSAGVPSVSEHGVLFSRRMVRDEGLRQTRSQAGRKGGTVTGGRLLKQKHKQTSSKRASKTQASESESESESERRKDPPTPQGGASGFDEFWSAYPRKTAKTAARKVWDRMRPDGALQEKILAAIERQRRSAQWQRGVIPHPSTWLNQQRWEDELPEAAEPQKEGIGSLLDRVFASKEAERNGLPRMDGAPHDDVRPEH